jgi:hypothetical protein
MSTDLAVIEAALKAATPGPWEASGHDSGHSMYELDWYVVQPEAGDAICDLESYERVTCNERHAQTTAEADAHLIANAPTWLAELLERVKAAEAHVVELARDAGDQRAMYLDAHAAGLRMTERAHVAEAEVERLADWKASALPVMDGLQELGKSLGLPLGARITGPLAYVAAETLNARAEAAEATIARVHALADSFEAEWPAGPDRDGATVAHLIRTALNHTDGITPESATSDEITLMGGPISKGFTFHPEPGEALVRPWPRYEPPAGDHESGGLPWLDLDPWRCGE